MHDTTDRTDTTAQLILRHRKGDPDAFGMLYQRHADAVCRSLALRVGRLPTEATDIEDVLQDTFVSAWRYIEDGQLDSFRTVGSFRALLVKIAMQKHSDALRHAFREKRDVRRQQPIDTDLFDGAGAPSEHARARELADAREEALLALPERDREVLDLRDNLEMSYAEIGAALGCKAGNARLRHFRAMERLREAVARKLGIDPSDGL